MDKSGSFDAAKKIYGRKTEYIRLNFDLSKLDEEFNDYTQFAEAGGEVRSRDFEQLRLAVFDKPKNSPEEGAAVQELYAFIVGVGDYDFLMALKAASDFCHMAANEDRKDALVHGALCLVELSQAFSGKITASNASRFQRELGKANRVLSYASLHFTDGQSRVHRELIGAWARILFCWEKSGDQKAKECLKNYCHLDLGDEKTVEVYLSVSHKVEDLKKQYGVPKKPRKLTVG